MRLIGYVVAVLLGLPSSLVAGAAVFADGPSILSSERVVPVVAVYLVVAEGFPVRALVIQRVSPGHVLLVVDNKGPALPA